MTQVPTNLPLDPDAGLWDRLRSSASTQLQLSDGLKAAMRSYSLADQAAIVAAIDQARANVENGANVIQAIGTIWEAVKPYLPELMLLAGLA
jgi:hypothetical protein